jgi:hypothetical protein
MAFGLFLQPETFLLTGRIDSPGHWEGYPSATGGQARRGGQARGSPPTLHLRENALWVRGCCQKKLSLGPSGYAVDRCSELMYDPQDKRDNWANTRTRLVRECLMFLLNMESSAVFSGRNPSFKVEAKICL